MNIFRTMVVNLGGTSAKTAVYENDKCIYRRTFQYSEKEMDKNTTGQEHVDVKVKYVRDWLKEIGVEIEEIDAFGVRLGGMFYGGDGGTFAIDGELRKQVDKNYHVDGSIIHPTRVTMALIDELQKDLKVKKRSFATDPSSINQYLPESRLTGCPLFDRKNSFHALSQRAAAKLAAKEIGKTYETANIIVIHAGGGISVGAHEKGRVIEANDSTGMGDGAFCTNRAGTVPAAEVLELAYSGKYTKRELSTLLNGESGLKGYLGTVDLREIEARISEGDEKAALVFKALAYQIAREVGVCYVAMHCEADAIAMTAGMANSVPLFSLIKEYVGKMAPMFRYTDDLESDALASGAYRVSAGLQKESEYKGEGAHVVPYS